MHPDRILFQAGHSLKLLDSATGKTEVFLKNAIKLLPDRIDEAQDHLDNLRDRNTKINCFDYGAIKVVGDIIFFDLRIRGSKQSPYDTNLCGLFSIDKAKHQIRLEHLLNKNEHVTDFDVDTDRTIVVRLKCYQDGIMIEQKRVVVGSTQSLLNEGWEIMPSGLYPEFGFHYLGS